MNLKKAALKKNPEVKVSKVWKAEDYVTPTILQEEVIEIKQAFDIFDTNKSGTVDPIELKNAFVSLGFASQNKFVLRILNDYEKQGIQGIDFAEFLRLSTSKLSSNISKAEVDKVFKHFDINKMGKVSSADLKKIAEQLNENLTDQDLEKMIIKADSDEDGFLTADDFYSVLINMNTTYQ